MRGKVTFEVAGREYTLQFTTNRICALEAETGEGIIAHAAKLENPDNIAFTDIRRMVRAAVYPPLTLDQAGDLIDEIGLHEALRLLVKAMNAAFDLQDDTGDGAGKPVAGAA